MQEENAQLQEKIRLQSHLSPKNTRLKLASLPSNLEDNSQVVSPNVIFLGYVVYLVKYDSSCDLLRIRCILGDVRLWVGDLEMSSCVVSLPR